MGDLPIAFCQESHRCSSMFSISRMLSQNFVNVHAIASCLMAPSRYLNQCWLVIIIIVFHNSAISQKMRKISWQKLSSRIFLQILMHLSRGDALVSQKFNMQRQVMTHTCVCDITMYNDDNVFVLMIVIMMAFLSSYFLNIYSIDRTAVHIS